MGFIAALLGKNNLEAELSSQLHGARTVVVDYLTKVAVVRACIDTLELRVIESVEGLKSELNLWAFFSGE